MRAYTDYPFIELGDEPHKEATIRECIVIKYDGDKYADIDIDGKSLSVKAGYLYKSYGRFGEVDSINEQELACILS